MNTPLHLRHEADALAAPLPPLLAEAKAVAASVAQGVHGRRRAGPGETFWQYRRYGAGDAASAIDWRQSARSDRLFVREQEWEASNTVYLWVDPSASMDYASARGGPDKRRRAAVLSLALACLLIDGGERVRLLGDAAPPFSGQTGLQRLAVTLADKAGPDALPANADVQRHARAVLISDFYTDANVVADALKHYAGRGVSGALLQVQDAAEETFPFSGRTLFLDPEGADGKLFGRAETVKSAYNAAAAAHRDALASAAGRMGWTFTVHRTDAPAAGALLALYEALAGQK